MRTATDTTTVSSTIRFRPILAVLVFFAIVAAACGSTGIDTSATTAATSEGIQPTVEYGASLDEWAAASQDSTPLDGALDQPEPTSDMFDDAYTPLEWDDLIPVGFSSQEIWEKYDDELQQVEFGTPEEEALYQKVADEIDHEVVEPGLDGLQIRMNGFVAPLTYDEDVVTEFLLVPFFGACIHVPAPPANQTVMVSVDKENGLTTDEAWGAVWVEGTITVDPETNDLGASSYKISGDNSGVYEGF